MFAWNEGYLAGLNGKVCHDLDKHNFYFPESESGNMNLDLVTDWVY